MGRPAKRLLMPLIPALFLAGMSAIAQDNLLVRDPGAIADPMLDPVNASMVLESVTAVALTLGISGDDAAVKEIKLVRIPARLADFSDDPGRIVVRAFDDGGKLVGRTSVSDRNVIARDGETIIASDRRLSAIVPVLGKPDVVVVTLPGLPSQPPLSVETVVTDFCGRFPEENICRGVEPEDSPYINRLRPKDP